MGVLSPQLDAAGGRVSVLLLEDDGERPIGAKRQALLDAADAEWVSFVDDDDEVSRDYVALALAAIDAGGDAVDLIGFRLRYFKDGSWQGSAVHTYAPGAAPTPGLPRHVRRQERLPNHLNPVRRALALAAGGFAPLNFGEDADYARRLAALRPRERFVDECLYNYLFRTHRPGERTNVMRAGGGK